MNKTLSHFSFFRSPFLLALLGLVCLYGAYHFIYGHRGVVAFMDVQAKLAQTQADREALKDEHAMLLSRVQRLRPGQIDSDYLDEQVVRVLGRRLNGPKHLIVQSQL